METVLKKLLSIDEVCDVIGVSKPTIYRKVKQGLFPSPLKVPTTATRGPKMVNRWDEALVLDYCLKMETQEKVPEVEPRGDDDAPTVHPEPWYVQHHFSVMAAIAGLLAGLAVWLFS